MNADELRERVIKAAEDEQWHNNQIQGFLYGNRHVIRDLSLTPGNQEIYSITSENYDALNPRENAHVTATAVIAAIPAVLRRSRVGIP